MNPYFKIEEKIEIENIEELVSLNIPEYYNKPGKSTTTNATKNVAEANFHYETSGMFRGQLRNWSLVPKCYRDADLIIKDSKDIIHEKIEADYQAQMFTFHEFCKRAESQNSDFPTKTSDRMSIAQHFGVPTPLLDWSKNILTSIFFAIREVFSNPEFQEEFKVYIYHIKDERLLNDGVPEKKDLAFLTKSSLIKPFPIDRRIERQKGIFSHHPHPKLVKEQIPISLYLLDSALIYKFIDLMKGFGFTEDYYFPDYAGIAKAVSSKKSS